MTMIRTLAVFATLLAVSASAAAQGLKPLEAVKPQLKAEATVTGEFVRVGDLVANAGIIANVPIFRAPDLGQTGTVPAAAVIEAVRQHALIGLDSGGIADVTVTRAARSIAAADIEAVVARALSAQFALGEPANIAVNFERDLRAIYVEPGAQGEPRVARIAFDARNNKFDATLEMPTGAANRGLLRLSGRATPVMEVVTLTRPLERGAIVKDDDLQIERRPRADIGRDILTARDRAVGLAAKSALQPGRPLRNADLAKPELVSRNDTVTLVYEVPGIVLSVRGKASEGGAEGDVVSVVNEQSKRVVQGIVAGPGRVVVSLSSPRLAANIQRPAQAPEAR
jgi:flagella basal body P-ring formation protein FlgA